MSARQRSASSLSHHNGGPSNSSSPGGYGSGPGGGHAPGAGGHYRHDPDPLILSAAEIPSFDATAIPSYGDGSPYPTMTATYIPSGMPPTTRPRAHTSADTSPSVAGAGAAAFAGLQPRTAARSAMAPAHSGMGVRHVSTSVLESNARAGMGAPTGGSGSGAAGAGHAARGAFPGGVGSPPGQNYTMTVPPPPPPGPPPGPPPSAASGGLPAHALNQREYQPHYAPRPDYRSAVSAPSQPNYHYSPHPPPNSHGGYYPVPPPPHPGQPVPYGYTPQPAPMPAPAHYQVRQPQDGSMYRHASAQSTESVSSTFSRVESTPESEHMSTPGAAHSASSRGTGRNVPPQSSAVFARPGLAQSPMSSVAIPEKDAQVWTPDRVQLYLQRHHFSPEWQQSFRALNIHGMNFLEMGVNDNVFNVVLPHLLQNNPGLDENKERKAAKNIKTMVSDLLNIVKSVPPSGPPDEHDAERPTTSHGPKPQFRKPSQRSTTLPTGYGENDQHPPPSAEHVYGKPNQDKASESSVRGRNEYSKNALSNVDTIRHSPSNSETGFQVSNYGHAQRPSLSGSPHESPNLNHQSIYTRHGKSNSQESIASSMSHRAGDAKGEKAYRILGIGGQKGDAGHDRPAARQESFDSHSGRSSGKLTKLRKKFWPKDGEVYEEESPTSPSWTKSGGLMNSPFAIVEHNGSSSSLDRASVSSVDGLRRPRSMRSLKGAAGGRSYILVTKDGKVFVLVDITVTKTAEEVRKEICGDLGFDWENATICLTEVGQKEHDETLSDQVLISICRDRADSIASLKFFVRGSPRSAVDSARSSTFMDKDMSSSPSKHAEFLTDPRPLFSERRPVPTPLETIDSASSTLVQSEQDDIKAAVESSAEAPHSSSPTSELPPDDEFGEIQRRLAHLRENYSQEPNPQINVIQPYSPLPPQPPSQPPMQHSPSDPPPASHYAYPDWQYETPGLMEQPATSPIDGGVSPSGRENELFFDEDRSPSASLTPFKGPHKGSAGTSKLEQAARQKLDTLSHQRSPEARPVESSHPEPRPAESRSVPAPVTLPQPRRAEKGFEKIIPPRPARVVDFDNPRPSPFEDKKMTLEHELIPQRRPPPPPVNRQSSNSWSKSMHGQQWPGDPHLKGSYASVQRKKSVDKRSHARPPEMLQKARPAQGGSPVGGIAGSLVQAGLMTSTITRTPVPGALKDSSVTNAASPPSAGSYTDFSIQQTPGESYPQNQFGAAPSAGSSKDSPRSGSTPHSPGYTWGRNQIFKIPDYESEATPGPQKLSLQIPPVNNNRPHAIPSLSPHEQEMAPRMRTPSLGSEIPFKENNIQFSSTASGGALMPSADDEDSDEDDGLFAIPIASRNDSSTAMLESNTQKTEPASTVDSPRPTLSIATKHVSFKPTPSTSATGTSSASTAQSPPSPEYEEGDDRQGLNSPSMHSSSGPTSAAAHPHSPADHTLLGRRNSFREDVWASRPPAEALINHLDDFFPNLDLDQPIIDEVHVSPPPSPSPSPATEKPQSYQLSDPPVAPPSEEPTSNIVVAPAGPQISGKAKQIPVVAQRNLGRQQLGRMKSIREVMKGAHENRKRFTQPSIGEKSNDILRRKSTKLFGAKTIEIKPGEGKRGAMRAQQLQQMQTQQQDNNLKRQATFKWFKGQLIGKGTYGRVYLGMNATTGEFLAVKQVEVSSDAGSSDHQKEMISALNQEIQTMQHLDHPNIVTYLGCERKEYGMSIFLEYISGGSVGSCLRKHGRFEEPVVRSLTRQTLQGLEYLHREGILHRDLKADNILLDLDGTCKISDFGISKKSDNIYGNDPGNSMQGSVFWMAPEVIRPENQGYSAKIDIWSLGCVVLEMFAGRRPWSKEEAIGAIFKLGSERQAPPVPEDVSEVISPSATAFLAECFEIEASERPTAARLLNEHDFCSLDTNFNFLDTELYHKIRGTFN